MFDVMLLSRLAALALATLCNTAGAGGDNHPPRLSVDYPADSWAEVGETVRFHVRAFDPDGDPVSLRVTPIDSAVLFQPAAAAGSGVEREFRYTVSHVASGITRFTFEAWDDVEPERRTRRTVTLRRLGSFGTGGSNLSDYSHSSIDFGDVTGDGRVDVVASAREADGALADAGAVYVWSGATLPSGPPSAVLTASSPVAGQRLGLCAGDGTLLADVTGDGVLDVVVASARATVGGAADAGAIYVFHGGAGLSGARTEDARLVAPTALPSHLLGASSLLGGNSGEQGLLVADIDGDGAEDLVASAPFTDVAGVSRAGAVYGWVGSALSGTVEANVVLTASGTYSGQYFGGEGNQAVQLRELTGDGLLDVVVGHGGQILVWSGAALTAGGAPTARLSVPSVPLGNPGSTLSYGYAPWMRFADVSGDGVTDVVAVALRSQEMFVFGGGAALVGDVEPSAFLASDAAPIGLPAFPQFGTFGVRIADVTFDGIADVMTPYGALYVYAGGERMQGRVRPSTRLEGFGYSLDQLAIEDVTGDGFADFAQVPFGFFSEGDTESVRGSSPGAAVGGVMIWRNAPGMHGRRGPDAELVDPLMSAANALVRDVQVADCDGDGVKDVLAAIFDLEPQPSHVAFWPGGDLRGQVQSTSQLAAPSGYPYVVPLPPVDVTGDGVADVLLHEQYFYNLGQNFPAELYLWRGGAGLAQGGAPDATFVTPGYTVGNTYTVDRDGDGVLDVFALRTPADLSAPGGGLFEWPGGPGLAGSIPPATSYEDPTEPDTEFGFFQSLGTFFLDLDGDGPLDLLSGGQLADTGAVQDTGALYLWLTRRGAALFQRLAVPGAQPLDQLGS